MKSWKDIFQEPVRREHADKVLQTVAHELEQNANKNKISRWAFLSALTAGVAGLVLWAKLSNEPAEGELEILALDEELLENLDFFDDLETLEEWDEQSDG
jgi:hypothetical protein